MRTLLAAATLLVLIRPALAVEPWPSGKLQLELEKLAVLGSVLYVAAHPDDENTKLIAYLANEAKVRTTYLSLTRGDGGQNLLGTDLGEKLGLIRTQELLAARRIDGGEQFFSRAIDFGYSKTPEESLEIWGHDAILSDVVWAIRKTRPDIIITRFSDEPGFTHGHHTASAWLAREAFAAAADPTRFPEQLEHVTPWAAQRLFWNTSSWFFRQREMEFDPTGLLSLDVGAYSPLLGKSIAEIASQSRSSHQTQGFGDTPEQGESLEYFKFLEGTSPSDSLLGGIDTTWARVPDSGPVAEAIQRAIAAFDPTAPAKSVPDLIAAHRALTELPDQPLRTRKLADLARVIAACLALDVESTSAEPTAVAGGEIALTLSAIQRSDLDVQIEFPTTGTPAADLASNQLVQATPTLTLPQTISAPYWLASPHEAGSYIVDHPLQIGTPENPPSLPIPFRVTVDGYPLDYTIPTTFNFNDPVRGEVKEPFVITPPATLNLDESTQIFGDTQPRPFTTRIRAATDITGGELRFVTADGWKTDPTSVPFDAKAGDEIPIEATLIPPPEASQSTLTAELNVDGQTIERGFERIEYDHIPTQTIFPPAQARLISLDVKIAGERIGYIPGAGDEIPEALQRIGYQVDTLTEADMRPETLKPYDAIVVGIRAVNTNSRIAHYLPALFDYASTGGVVILQYNTSRGLQTEDFSPIPLELSRDRVTDETAEMRFLAPDHPVLNFPNPITAADFDGWVQERGLYFASKWDPAFTAIFSINDADESPLDGSLLIARHGEGTFVYTGLSFFRQLPAGVPGAYRLFANLVSLGHAE